ncbi:MAG: ead/Ea22-like family protein [Afipia sp.]
MAELDLDALEQAAREAGGGCWFSTGWTVGSRGFEVGDLKSRDRICSDATERCAEFIAAANPATILELLDRLKAAEKRTAKLEERCAVLTDSLRLAVRQNNHDMLMTAEELRSCEAILEKTK